MKTIVIIIVSILAIAGGFGCAALSEYVTPATLDERAIQYAANSGTVDPFDFDGYQNLEKALRLESAVHNAHEVNQLAYQQMAEKDQLDYAQLNEITLQNRQIAQQREELIFGEEGLLTLGLSMAGFGTLTGLIGLMRKRPGDITPEEMEKAVVDIKGEITDKDRQLIEIVKGVQKVLETAGTKDNNLLAQFKSILGNYQSADTKETVAKVKSTL
jgi:hypothetical protein